MKICIIGDSHFGARSDSPLFLNYFFKFFDNELFPYLKANNINTVIHLGDLFDRRKFVNFHTLKHVRERFMNWFEDNNVDLHCILGNHDVFYKNTNHLNSPKELFVDCYSKFHLYEQTTELVVADGTKFLMVPWINEENKSAVIKAIEASTAPVVCGHFELNGYEMISNIKCSSGMEDKFLQKFELVLSGHFHTKSSKGNIHYLGTQYEMTTADLHQDKGFHVYDTETRELTFIKNPHKMYYSIEWTDKRDFSDLDPSVYKNTYVRVLVLNKKNERKFDEFIDLLYTGEPASITIIEDIVTKDDENSPEFDIAEDTLSLINREIEFLESDNTEQLKEIMRQVYMETLS